MRSGRTEPILLRCRHYDGTSASFVVKVSGPQFGAPQLIHEAVSSCLAQHIGVNTPQGAIVYGLSELADVARSYDIDFSRRLTAAVQPTFGSKYIKSFPLWNPNQTPMDTDPLTSLRVFTFDVFLENTDRRLANPNLHRRNGEFCVIDHEMTFSATTTFIIGGSLKCWEYGGADWLCNRDQHALYLDARENVALLNEVRKDWSALGEAQVDTILTAIPSEWISLARPSFDKIAAYLHGLVDNLDRAFDELERALRA